MMLRPPLRAFTLIELLVAIGLMVLLLGTVATVFFGATDVFQTHGARMRIAENACTSLDLLARDLAGRLPVSSGEQAFWM